MFAKQAKAPSGENDDASQKIINCCKFVDNRNSAYFKCVMRAVTIKCYVHMPLLFCKAYLFKEPMFLMKT